MEDLFVVPAARGRGIAEALIAACADHCRRRGAELLSWQTAPSNLRAQRVYDRVGATAAQWIDYSLPVVSTGPTLLATNGPRFADGPEPPPESSPHGGANSESSEPAPPRSENR